MPEVRKKQSLVRIANAEYLLFGRLKRSVYAANNAHGKNHIGYLLLLKRSRRGSSAMPQNERDDVVLRCLVHYWIREEHT
jgi:hypothetical protein